MRARPSAHGTKLEIEDVRIANASRVLQGVIDGDGQATRAEIARATELTSATVSSIVEDLIADGLVTFGSANLPTRGKPARTLCIREDDKVIGVVLPESRQIRWGAVAPSGRVLWTDRQARLAGPLEPTEIAAVVTDLTRRASLAALSIRVSGTVDGTVVHESADLQLNDTDLAPMLAEASRVPAFVVNDADAAALAEFSRSGNDARSQLFVWIGKGLGATFILDGRLWRGSTGRAGEFGHLQTDNSKEAPRCHCGAQGCLELAVGLPTILGIDDLTDLAAGTGELEARLASREARALLAKSHRQLARVLVTITAAVDVPEIVISGPVVALGASYLDGLRSALAEQKVYGTVPATVRFGARSDDYRAAAAVAAHDLWGITWKGQP